MYFYNGDKDMLRRCRYSERLETQEINFLNNAKDRILQLGTQFGQPKKIINAYEVLHNALDGSIENIFYSPEFRLKGPLREKNLKEIANFLTEKRGAIAHGRFSSMFSDTDALIIPGDQPMRRSAFSAWKSPFSKCRT